MTTQSPLEVENGRLQFELEECQSAKEELEVAKEILEQDLRLLEETHHELQSSFDREHAEVAGLRATNAKLVEQVKEFTLQLSSRADAQVSLDEADDELLKEKELNAHLQLDLDDSQAEIARLRELQSAQETDFELRSQADALSRKQMEETVEALRVDLANSRQQLLDVQSELDVSRQRIADLEQEAKQGEFDRTAMAEKLLVAEQKLVSTETTELSTEKQLAEERALNQQLKDKLSTMEPAFTSLQHELDESRRSVTSLTEARKELQSQLDSLQAENDHLTRTSTKQQEHESPKSPPPAFEFSLSGDGEDDDGDGFVMELDMSADEPPEIRRRSDSKKSGGSVENHQSSPKLTHSAGSKSPPSTHLAIGDSALSARVTELEAECESLKAQVTELSSQLTSSQTHVTERERIGDEQKEAISELSAKLASLTEELAAEREALRTSATQLEEDAKTIRDLRSSHSLLTEDVQQSSLEATELRSQLAETVESHEQSVKQFAMTEAEHTAQVSTLTKRCEDLEAQVKELEITASAGSTELHTLLHDCQERLSSCQSELESAQQSLTQTLEEKKQITADYEALSVSSSQQLAALQAENQQLRESDSTHRSALGGYDAEFSALQNTISELQTAQAVAVTELGQVLSHLSEEEQRVLSLTEELSEAQASVEALQKLIDFKNSSADDEILTLSNERDALQQSKDVLISAMEKMRAERDESQRVMEGIASQTHMVEQTVQQLHLDKENLQTALATAQSELEASKQFTTSLESQLSLLNEQLAARDASIGDLRSGKSSVELSFRDEIIALQAAISQHRFVEESLRTDLARLETERQQLVSEHSSVLSLSQSSVDRLTAEVQASTLERDATIAELGIVREELEQVRESVISSDALVTELRSQLLTASTAATPAVVNVVEEISLKEFATVDLQTDDVAEPVPETPAPIIDLRFIITAEPELRATGIEQIATLELRVAELSGALAAATSVNQAMPVDSDSPRSFGIDYSSASVTPVEPLTLVAESVSTSEGPLSDSDVEIARLRQLVQAAEADKLSLEEQLRTAHLHLQSLSSGVSNEPVVPPTEYTNPLWRFKLEASLRTSNTEKKLLERNVSDLAFKIADVEATLQSTQALVAQLRQDLQSSQLDRASAFRELQTLKEHLSQDASDETASFQQLLSEKETLSRRVAELEAALTVVPVSSPRASRFHSSGSIPVSPRTRSGSISNISQSDYAVVVGERDALREEMHVVNDRLQSAHAELQHVLDSRLELSHSHENVLQILSQTESQLFTKEEQLQLVLHQLDTLQAEKSRLDAAYMTATNGLSESTRNQSQILSEKEHLQQQFEQSQTNLLQMNSEMQVLLREMQTMEQLLLSATDAQLRAEQETVSVRAEATKAQQTLSQLETAYKKDKARWEESLSAMNRERQKVDDELGATLETIGKHKQATLALISDNKRLEAAAARLQKELANAAQARTESESICESLRSELSLLRKRSQGNLSGTSDENTESNQRTDLIIHENDNSFVSQEMSAEPKSAPDSPRVSVETSSHPPIVPPLRILMQQERVEEQVLCSRSSEGRDRSDSSVLENSKLSHSYDHEFDDGFPVADLIPDIRNVERGLFELAQAAAQGQLEVNSLQQNLMVTQQQLAETLKLNTDLLNDCRGLAAERDAARAELVSLRANYETAKKQVADLTKKKTQIQTQCQTYKKELSMLQLVMHKEKSSSDSVEASDLQALKTKLSAVQASLKQKDGMLAAVQSELHRMEGVLHSHSSLVQEVEALRTQCATQESAIAQKDKHLEILVSQLPLWQDQMKKLSAEVRQMRKTRRQDQETIRNLTSTAGSNSVTS